MNNTKLSEPMTRILLKAADKGVIFAIGREMASARALEARGLVALGKVRRGGYDGDTSRDTVRVTITDPGFEAAIDLI